jgi:hypothetical protein
MNQQSSGIFQMDLLVNSILLSGNSLLLDSLVCVGCKGEGQRHLINLSVGHRGAAMGSHLSG